MNAALASVVDGLATAAPGLAAQLLHGTLVAACVALAVRGLAGRLPRIAHAAWWVALLAFVPLFGPAMPWSLADLIANVSPTSTTTIAPSSAPMAGPVATAASASVAWSAWVLAMAMLVIATVAGVRMARGALASHRAVCAARAWPQAPAWVQAQVGRRVTVHLAADEVRPHVVGAWRSHIVLPASWLDQPPATRAAVLAHELAHVRHGDLWLVKLERLIVHALWFWPVARWVARRVEAAREAACDARAITVSGLRPAQYAQLLLEATRRQAMAYTPAVASLRFGASYAMTRARVEAAMAPRAGRLGQGLALSALVGLAAWSLATPVGLAPPAVAVVCTYDDDVASALLALHPEADRDRSGAVSRDEACDFQARLRDQQARAGESAVSAPTDAGVELVSWQGGPICCNCESGEGTPTAREPQGVSPELGGAQCREGER